MGITKIIAVSMHQKSIEETIQIKERGIHENWPINIYPALGIHPWEAHKPFDLQFLTEMLKELKYPLVGEIGLDHRFVPKKRWKNQEQVFGQMLQVAEAQSAPVIIHSKDAEAQTLELLTTVTIRHVIMHWYTGPLSIAKKAQDKGYFFSITPAIDYSTVLKRIVQVVPLEQLLLESDGPVGYRLPLPIGKIYGTPSWVPIVAHRICQLRKIEKFDEFIQQMMENLDRLLQLSET